VNANLQSALTIQASAQAAQNIATTIEDYQNVVIQWVACGQAASSAGNDAAGQADAAQALAISENLKEIADANHQLANYSASIEDPSVTLQLATELAAESGTEAGYAIQGATAALQGVEDVAGGVGPAPAPVTPPAASSGPGVVGGLLVAAGLGGLMWLAFEVAFKR
jgi:hypothetical protein